MEIIFIGTPKFASVILKGLVNSNYKPILVITAPDKPAGRKQILTPSEVKLTAQKYGIPIEQPEKIAECKNRIKKLKPDLIVLTAYGQIMPKEILDIPKYKSINIHPSLLPKYRGASPIQNTILNGDKKTGITIYIMDEKMDHGPMLKKREVIIKNPKINFEELSEKLALEGKKLLLEILPKINKIKPEEQDHSKATYTKIIKKEDGHINWKNLAEEIERQIRAFHIWPTSFSLWNKTRLKILEADVKELPDNLDYPYGKVVASPENELLVNCQKNYLLIKKLQIEGKKPMNSEDFLRGYPDIIGAVLD